MHITVPKNGSSRVPLCDLTNSCGKYGVIVQSLDGNGSVFVGTDEGAMQGGLDGAGNSQDGILLKQFSSISNVPSTIILAPFSGKLYAINVGANDSILAVIVIPLE